MDTRSVCVSVCVCVCVCSMGKTANKGYVLLQHFQTGLTAISCRQHLNERLILFQLYSPQLLYIQEHRSLNSTISLGHSLSSQFFPPSMFL